MGNAGTSYPINLDPGFNAAGVDPNVGPAVQAMQTYIGGYTGPASIKNVTMQNFPDELATSTLQPASGTVSLCLVQLRAGQVINNLNLLTAAQAAVTPTHQWAGIASYVAGSNGVALAVTADGTNTAIGADAVLALALTAPYTVLTSGLYYLYFCIVAGTVPTFAAAPTLSGHGRGNIAPFPCGPGDTGKSTPYAAAATVTAPTAVAANALIYCN